MSNTDLVIDLNAVKNYIMTQIPSSRYSELNIVGDVEFYINSMKDVTNGKTHFSVKHDGVQMVYMEKSNDVALEFDNYSVYQYFKADRWLEGVRTELLEVKKSIDITL